MPPTNQVAPALAATTTLPAAATYNPATATAANAGNVNATAANAGTANWVVDTPQTVSGQVKNIIDTNSPLMQQAETSAKQAANSRGLLNSSLAVGAGQDAVIRAALPIAQQDAGTFANSAQYNAGEANQTNRFNASNQQQVNLTNAGEANQTNRYNASNEQQAGLMNAEAQNQAGQFGAQQKNAMATTQAQLEADTNKLNVQQANAMVINQLDQAKEMALQTLKGSQAQTLAATEAQYKTAIQTSDSAAKFYTAILGAMATSQTATGTDATQKAAAATYYNNSLKNGLAIISAAGGTSNTDLSSLLRF